MDDSYLAQKITAISIPWNLVHVKADCGKGDGSLQTRSKLAFACILGKVESVKASARKVKKCQTQGSQNNENPSPLILAKT